MKLRRRPRRRSTTLLVGTLLVAVLVTLVVGLRASTAVTLDAELDRNYRPLYDLLVRSPSTGLDGTRLVEESFLGYPGPTAMTLNDVARVRAVDGVDVVAPVGVVGFLESTTAAPLVALQIPTHPTWYVGEVKVTADSGAQPVVAYNRSFSVAIKPGDPPRIQTSGLVGYAIDEASSEMILQLFPLERVRELVIAVDPTAEAALVGPIGALSALAAAGSAPPLAEWEPGPVAPEFDGAHDFVRLSQRRAVESNDTAALTRPVVPLAVNGNREQKLTLVVSGAVVDLPLPQIGDTLPAASDKDLIGHVSAATAIDDFTPFTAPNLTISWPGQALSNGGVYRGPIDQSFTADLLAAPTYETSADKETAFTITPLGRHAGIGSEQQYREIRPVAADGADGDFQPADPYAQPFFLAPIAAFDLIDFDVDASAVNYVPLGTYDQSSSEWVRAADGSTRQEMLHPTLLPTGLIKPAPAALIDIANAHTIRGDRVVDAMRIRLDPSIDYSADGVERVNDIAGQITDLGFDVDVMAGSSPQQVSVYVPAYFAGDQDLGWVTEPWARIGATMEIGHSISTATYGVAALALVAAMLIAWAVNVVEAAAATQPVRVLGESGWSRRQVTWFVLRPSVAASAFALLLVALSAVFAPRTTSRFGILTAVGVVAIWLAFGAAALGMAMRRPDQRSPQSARSRRSFVRARPWALARASVWRCPNITISQAIAASIAGVTAAPAALVLWEQADALGATRMGVSVGADLRGRQLAMLVASFTAAVGAHALVTGRERRIRRAVTELLGESGWREADVRRWQRRRELFHGTFAAAAVTAIAPVTATVLELAVVPTLLAALAATLTLAAVQYAIGGLRRGFT